MKNHREDILLEVFCGVLFVFSLALIIGLVWTVH